MPEVVVNEFGFRVDAAIIGQEHKAHAWYEDSNAPTSTLDIIAASRGVPPEVLKQ